MATAVAGGTGGRAVRNLCDFSQVDIRKVDVIVHKGDFARCDERPAFGRRLTASLRLGATCNEKMMLELENITRRNV